MQKLNILHNGLMQVHLICSKNIWSRRIFQQLTCIFIHPNMEQYHGSGIWRRMLLTKPIWRHHSSFTLQWEQEKCFLFFFSLIDKRKFHWQKKGVDQGAISWERRSDPISNVKDQTEYIGSYGMVIAQLANGKRGNPNWFWKIRWFLSLQTGHRSAWMLNFHKREASVLRWGAYHWPMRSKAFLRSTQLS